MKKELSKNLLKILDLLNETPTVKSVGLFPINIEKVSRFEYCCSEQISHLLEEVPSIKNLFFFEKDYKLVPFETSGTTKIYSWQAPSIREQLNGMKFAYLPDTIVGVEVDTLLTIRVYYLDPSLVSLRSFLD